LVSLRTRAVVVVESCTGFKDERDLLRGVI
jgi:hypothetical protein